MTVALDEAADAATDEWQGARRPAGWWARAAAFGIDVLLPVAVAAGVLFIVGAMIGWPWQWLCLVLAAAVIVVLAVGRSVMTNITGSSLGRSVVGIEVVDREGGGRPSLGRLLLRDLAHVLDTVPLALGWLWPLLDARGRTFADMLTGTEVLQVDGARPDRRRLATWVIAALAGLSVLGGVLGYALVYRQQQSLTKAREQIAAEGPKMVAEMLSYTVKTAPDDFAKAQTLVTDGYRPELTQQQEAVRKTGLVDNDYWVSNSAVLSSSQDRAAMLLLLQGQRGAAPTQRFLTASVRAEYEKTGGQWKISNLAVLSAPKPPPPPDPAPSKPEPAPPKSAAPKPAPPKSEVPKSDAPKPAPPKPAPKPAPATPGGGGR